MGLDDVLVVVFGLVVVVVAVERRAKLPHAAADGARHLRQPLRPEDDQRDDQDDQELEWTDVEHAAARIVRPGSGGAAFERPRHRLPVQELP